ncbi:hypothetical protein JX265_002402 [Neoarthrinium moseri]|uniref:Uncharacterized protein n=1 Tax=Neoarthrinium moseri TaxID=1658444 RepID=A0A9Q0AU97_9PEZI|nr:hypothetical protein JX265_002402 [Neoarthrinium moseri]
MGSPGHHTGKSKLRRIDFVGNMLFVPSTLAVLPGLVMGGIEHPWSSWRVILPLAMGGSVLIQAIGYFFPVYFQAVKGTTVLKSGTFYLPYAIGSLFFAVLGGVLLAKLDNYKILHFVAFALSSLGIGSYPLLDSETSKVAWVFIELVSSAGLGITVSTMLPAIMSALAEADVASSTAAYSFIKTFGYVWGVTIASIIFNAAINANLDLVSDPAVRDRLRDSQAYAFASEVHGLREASAYSPEIWKEIAQVYTRSLRTIWWVGLGFSLVGLLLAFGERAHELRSELETEYGLRENEKKATTT